MLMLVKTTCPWCHNDTYIQVDAEEYCRWMNGTPIQQAMPDLDENEREMLISGICPECWDTLWDGEWEDEDEEEDFDFEDSVDEMGFDPYMGCYSFDC